MQFAAEHDEQQQEMEQEMEADRVSFRKIEEMESFGVAKPDIKKLKEGGYHTIEAVSPVWCLLGNGMLA